MRPTQHNSVTFQPEMWLKINNVFFCLFVFLMVSCLLSCSDITEQDMAFSAGLHVVSPGDLTVSEVIRDVDGARSLMVYPGKLYVASTSGVVYCYDSETLSLTDEFIVGTPSPAGYSSFLHSPTENTAYLTGAQGKILELSIPDFSVVDEFSVCEVPSELEITTGNPGYLWVVDGMHNTIDQVDLNVHESYYTMHVIESSPIKAIEASSYYDDTYIFGTPNSIHAVQVLGPGSIRRRIEKDLYGRPWLSFCSIPNDSNYIGITGTSSQCQLGEVCMHDSTMYWFVDEPPRFYYNSSVTGSDWITAPGNDNYHMYALGYYGEGFSRLYRYTYIGPSYGINGTIDIPGYPLDLKVSDTGVIYILTVGE